MSTTPLSPTFKMVLLVVVVFTSLSFVTTVALVWAPETATMKKEVVEMSSTTFKLGFGALVGLLGGKSV
ncbi:MAG: hypothetical protein M3271_01585 [Actinomycetota bacterium]|nr:hypothetical protein [Actinomycetota bacterium]